MKPKLNKELFEKKLKKIAVGILGKERIVCDSDDVWKTRKDIPDVSMFKAKSKITVSNAIVGEWFDYFKYEGKGDILKNWKAYVCMKKEEAMKKFKVRRWGLETYWRVSPEVNAEIDFITGVPFYSLYSRFVIF